MMTERPPDSVAETALRGRPRAEFPARRSGARALLAERRLVTQNAVAERDGNGQGRVVPLADHVHAVALVRRALAGERLEAPSPEVVRGRPVRCRRRRHSHLALNGSTERILRSGMLVVVMLVVFPPTVEIFNHFLYIFHLLSDGDFVK